MFKWSCRFNMHDMCYLYIEYRLHILFTVWLIDLHFPCLGAPFSHLLKSLANCITRAGSLHYLQNAS